MKIKDLMTSNPRCCTSDTSIQEIARLMVQCDCGEIPVLESLHGGQPIGVVTDRDICCRAVAEGKLPAQTRARDVMTSPCITVMPDMKLDDCVKLMEDKQIRRVVVVDEAGRCCGIVAQADIARHDRSKREVAEVVKKISEPARASA